MATIRHESRTAVDSPETNVLTSNSRKWEDVMVTSEASLSFRLARSDSVP